MPAANADAPPTAEASGDAAAAGAAAHPAAHPAADLGASPAAGADARTRKRRGRREPSAHAAASSPVEEDENRAAADAGARPAADPAASPSASPAPATVARTRKRRGGSEPAGDAGAPVLVQNGGAAADPAADPSASADASAHTRKRKGGRAGAGGRVGRRARKDAGLEAVAATLSEAGALQEAAGARGGRRTPKDAGAKAAEMTPEAKHPKAAAGDPALASKEAALLSPPRTRARLVRGERPANVGSAAPAEGCAASAPEGMPAAPDNGTREPSGANDAGGQGTPGGRPARGGPAGGVIGTEQENPDPAEPDPTPEHCAARRTRGAARSNARGAADPMTLHSDPRPAAARATPAPVPGSHPERAEPASRARRVLRSAAKAPPPRDSRAAGAAEALAERLLDGAADAQAVAAPAADEPGPRDGAVLRQGHGAQGEGQAEAQAAAALERSGQHAPASAAPAGGRAAEGCARSGPPPSSPVAAAAEGPISRMQQRSQVNNLLGKQATPCANAEAPAPSAPAQMPAESGGPAGAAAGSTAGGGGGGARSGGAEGGKAGEEDDVVVELSEAEHGADVTATPGERSRFHTPAGLGDSRP